MTQNNKVKMASHVRFDEGMNDLPIDAIPPNVQHLQRSEFGKTYPEESVETSINEFHLYRNPFSETLEKTAGIETLQTSNLWTHTKSR